MVVKTAIEDDAYLLSIDPDRKLLGQSEHYVVL